MARLSPEQIEFCRIVGLTIGWDVDSEEPQLTHICWPHMMWWGALCSTEKLWFSGGDVDIEEITCDACLKAFEELKSKDIQLLRGIGILAKTVTSLQKIEDAAEDYLESGTDSDRYELFLRIREENERFSRLVRGE